MLTARFPSLTLSFIALSLPLMHIINVLSQLNAGKRCWLDTVVYYYHLGRERVQACQELSTFLSEQFSQKEVLDRAESENELNILQMGWKEAKGVVRKGMITKEMSLLKFLWPKLRSYC